MEDQSESLKQFYIDLRSDWRRWAVLQIKQAMITGKHTIPVTRLRNNMYKKTKTILNFWKCVPDSEVSYYDKFTNITIIDPRTREIIDFARSLGLQWFVQVNYDDNLLSTQVLNLHITCYYTPEQTQLQ